MTYEVSPRVAHQVVGGEVVLVDLAGARMLGLNASGSLVWSLLVEGQDEEAIARALGERYGVDVATARGEIRGFVGTLVTRGLITSAA
jgi:hypothetical protein